MPACLSDVERRRAGAAVVAGDEHDVGVRLGHPGRHRADADLGHQLHVHAGRRVGRLEVVDELGDVLDRVDVVVRRRRDQPDARASSCGSGRSRARPCCPGAGRPRRAWRPGPILICRSSALTRYSLGHAEAAGRHLLDGAAPQVAVRVGREAVRVLAALAGVGACRRCGSWRWRASRGPPSRWSRRTWRRWRSASRSSRPARPRRSGSAPPSGRLQARSSPRRVPSFVGLVVDRGACTP